MHPGWYEKCSLTLHIVELRRNVRLRIFAKHFYFRKMWRKLKTLFSHENLAWTKFRENISVPSLHTIQYTVYIAGIESLILGLAKWWAVWSFVNKKHRHKQQAIISKLSHSFSSYTLQNTVYKLYKLYCTKILYEWAEEYL